MGFARRLARPYRLEEIREATILGILALHVGNVMVGIPPLADRTGVQEPHLFRGCQNSDLYIGDVELVRYSENVCPQSSAGAVVSAVRLYEAFSSSPAHLGKHG